MIYLHTLQLVANGYILMFTGFGIGISHRDATIDLGGNLFWTGFMMVWLAAPIAVAVTVMTALGEIIAP